MQTSNWEIMESRMRIEDGRPHFYKLVHGEDVKKHLRIPPSFIKNLAGEISGTATLTRSSGGQWHVRTWKNPNGTYLEDGWSRFMRENKLGDDEFLVFRYDGNMHFHVKIFGKNGLKRSAAAMAEEKGAVVLSDGKKRSRGRPRKYPICPPSSRGRPRKYPICPPPGTGEKKPEPFTSNFPYFSSLMTKSCVERSFLLTIPVPFSNSHFPPSRMKVLLRNSAGKAWEVICIYHTKRHYISGGWGAFVRDNSLKLGDTCIFELVQRNLLQVHVF